MALRIHLSNVLRRNITSHGCKQMSRPFAMAIRSMQVPLSLAGAPPRSEPHSTTLTFSGAAEYVTPSSSQRKKLYETHIPIPLRQKVFLAAGSAVTALSNPLRGATTSQHMELIRFKFPTRTLYARHGRYSGGDDRPPLPRADARPDAGGPDGPPHSARAARGQLADHRPGSPARASKQDVWTRIHKMAGYPGGVAGHERTGPLRRLGRARLRDAALPRVARLCTHPHGSRGDGGVRAGAQMVRMGADGPAHDGARVTLWPAPSHFRGAQSLVYALRSMGRAVRRG
ncbi:hypothetical protein BC938DRAFT_482343 [Jimgerdemannia flammicorona]|uniref:Uncharacterized protein n=1 Tax=Jimgerdemannia flammicorona TaxID=994334 RepID=A0A433QE84_9FUNG|nr:hypothetical protein BC938DRAFT_482343 [Jimgerdemannia flammicorona]